MSGKKLGIVVASIAAVGLCFAIVFLPKSRQTEVGRSGQPKAVKTSQEGKGGIDAKHILGGSATTKATKNNLPGDDKHTFDYGTLPKIKADANPQVKAVAQALRDKKHPEKISTHILPKPFDAKAYQANPDAYLSAVEPGRVFQTAQPGKDVPRATAVSPRFQQVTQGQSVVLRVSAPAGAPVSFTTFDCGQFENQLGAITVKADKDGVAEAKFTTTGGTIEDMHILAASPMASGQVRFIINVKMPATGTAAMAKR